MSQKALLLPAASAAHVVQSVAIRKPTRGQILVKIEAAALNPFDWMFSRFNAYTDSYPLILGFDGAGIVEDVGSDVSDFEKGDRVIFQGWHDDDAKVLHGTFQQYIVVPTYVAAKIPSSISFEAGSTLYSALATVGIVLFSHKPGTESLKLSPPWEDGGLGKYAGQSAFISGGATNVGQFAIQLAKLAGFSPIIATASLHNTDLLKSNGATHVIDRKLPFEEIVDSIKAIVGTSGVDLVYDAVSEDDTIRLSVAVLRQGGRLAYVLPTAVKLVQKLVAEKELESACARGLMSDEANRGALAGLWEKLPQLFASGTIKLVPFEVLSGGLSGIPGGLKRLKNNQVSGVKLVVNPLHTTD